MIFEHFRREMLIFPITSGISYRIALHFLNQSPTLTTKIIHLHEDGGPAVNPVNVRGIQQHTPVVRFTTREN